MRTGAGACGARRGIMAASLPLFRLTGKGFREHKPPEGPACTGGALSFQPGNHVQCNTDARRFWNGEVPEWLKGTDCRSVGYAYAGSKPALSTNSIYLAIPSIWQFRPFGAFAHKQATRANLTSPATSIYPVPHCPG